MKRRLPNRAIFTFVFIIALISFVAYFASKYSVKVVVPTDVSLDELLFNAEHFSLLGEAEYPPDQGLANGIAYEDEKGIIHQVTYPDYDDSVRGYLLDLDSGSNVIKVFVWNSGSVTQAKETWERLYMIEGSVMTRERGRIKKAGYFYARIIRFGGKDETLLWQKDRWV
ncbi:MAG: hypothetical protein QM447_10490, partial [Thermotogota bacterium]|nr:hypothetical protein [Thermotogota bacterium]